MRVLWEFSTWHTFKNFRWRPKCAVGKFWWTHTHTKKLTSHRTTSSWPCVGLRVRVDALRPHGSAGTRSRLAGFKTRRGCWLLPAAASLSVLSIRASSPFSVWVWREVTLVRPNCLHSFNSTCRVKKPSHSLQQHSFAASLFPSTRRWIQGIRLLGNGILYWVNKLTKADVTPVHGSVSGIFNEVTCYWVLKVSASAKKSHSQHKTQG